MNTTIVNIINALEAIKHITKKGGEYWMARELMKILGYTEWRNFLVVIERATDACRSIGEDVNDHFVETNKMVEIGSGAQKAVTDYYLDRYACYLIAQNGDPSKIEIAAAQTYFAIQTRRQEITDAKNHLLEQRIHLRNRVTQAIKELNKVAKTAGVQRYDVFHNAGYKGLYSMGLADVKKRKGISKKEDLFDRVGRAELAANEFRLTQAEEKIKRDQISTEQDAISTHKQVAREVRETIRKIGGTMPEDLPSEPSLKQLTKETRKISKKEKIK